MSWSRFLWRNLVRNKLRSLLTGSAIALAVALVCFLATMPEGLDRLLDSVSANTRIVVHDEHEESGNVGLVIRDQVNQRRRRFEITSFHSVAMPIEIVDRVPVARDNDIRIDVLKGATPPTTVDLNGHAGVYLWRLAGEPRKTETIRHYYSVKFPRNKALAQNEGG